MANSYASRLGTAPEEAVKAPCVVAALTNITLSGEQTISGIAVEADDRVFVAGQTDATENGIYDASADAWTRATDWNDVQDVVNGQLISVPNALYQAAFTGSFAPDTTEPTFTEVTNVLAANFTRYELGSSAAAASHVGIITGHMIETTYLDGNRTADSGCQAIFTGTTTIGEAGKWFGTATDGKGYDALGQQFSMIRLHTLGFGSNIAAAIAAAGSTPQNLLVDGSITMAADAVVPLTLGFEVQKGAIITTTGYVLTITGPIEAGDYQIFAGTGNVLMGSTREVQAIWWPNYATNGAGAINEAFESIGGIVGVGSGPSVRNVRTNGAYVAPVGGIVKLHGTTVNCTESVNMTGLISGYYELIGVSNSTILQFGIDDARPICFDLTGSNHITFKDFKITGSDTNSPNVGIFQARDVSSGSGLFHYFYNVIFSNKFSKACFYNYASEENRYFNCYMQCNSNDAVGYWQTGDNNGTGEDITSPFTTIPTTQQSSSDNQFFGCSFLMQGDGNTDCMHFRTTYNVNVFGSYFANTGSAALQVLDIDDNDVSGNGGIANGTYPISFSGGTGGADAAGTYTIVSNEIDSVAITNNGTGYTSNDLVCATSNGEGTITPYVYGPRSAIYVDNGGPAPCLNINIDGFRHENSGVVQYTAAIAGASTCARISFRNGWAEPVLAGIAAVGVQGLTWENINLVETQPRRGAVFIHGTISQSHIKTATVVYIAGTVTDTTIEVRSGNLTVVDGGTLGSTNRIIFTDTGLERPGKSETLLSVTTVAFNADADTVLFTVPAGLRCVLTKAVVVAGATAGATTTLSIGQNGATTDWLAVNTLTSLDIANDSVVLQPIPNTTPLKGKSYAAATVIEGTVANQSGGATNTVYLYGMLY